MKCRLCFSAFSNWSSVKEDAWDIEPLYKKSKGTRNENVSEAKLILRPKGWGRSVQVGDRCYDAGAVNYVMYGVMGRLCKGYEDIKDWGDIWDRIALWKQVAYGHGPNTETTDWAYNGWMGWPNSNIPRSETPYPVRNIAEPAWLIPAYRWNPNGENIAWKVVP